MEGCPAEGSQLLEGEQCHKTAQAWEQLAGLRRGKGEPGSPTAPGERPRFFPTLLASFRRSQKGVFSP